MQRKQKMAIRMLLIALLLGGSLVSAGAEVEIYPQAPEVYVKRLEDAIIAQYGEPDAWPAVLGEAVASVRQFSQAKQSEIDTPDISAHVDEIREGLLAEYGSTYGWPHELIALVAGLEGYASVGTPWFYGFCMLPGEDDLPEEEAFAIAREAIREAYDLTEEEIMAIEPASRFCLKDEYFPIDHWYVILGLNDQGFERYYAFITSPDGEVLRAERNDGNG